MEIAHFDTIYRRLSTNSKLLKEATSRLNWIDVQRTKAFRGEHNIYDLLDPLNIGALVINCASEDALSVIEFAAASFEDKQKPHHQIIAYGTNVHSIKEALPGVTYVFTKSGDGYLLVPEAKTIATHALEKLSQ